MNKEIIKWLLCCILVPILVVVVGIISILITTYWEISLTIFLCILIGTYTYFELFR